MEKLTETTQEQSSEYTVIGEFVVDTINGGYYDVEVRDFSDDASVVVFNAYQFDLDEDWTEIHSEWEMDITSPTHGNTVMYHLIAAFGKIDDKWFEDHGWTKKERKNDGPSNVYYQM